MNGNEKIIMTNTAVLLTVFNRREVTLAGLRTLRKAISKMPPEYHFDIFMTNDGCSDGTAEAVSNEFPDIKIISGDGTLFWSGGMRKAWTAAIEYSKYDFFLWFNDDAMLYEDALQILFETSKNVKTNSVISGAFCDDQGCVSYGGKTKNWKIIAPKAEEYQSIHWMNGNLVLVPRDVYEQIGMIDRIFVHGKGDYDYGRRAIKAGFSVYLTDSYVGETNRHDNPRQTPYKKGMGIYDRMKMLYSPRHSPITAFVFCKRHIGLITAMRVFIQSNLKAMFPQMNILIYKLGKRKRDVIDKI